MGAAQAAGIGPGDRPVVPLTPLSIAILGTRGVPPRYGGFETFAAELGKRLVQRGHEVTVYCRSSLYPERPADWEGVRRIDLPAVRHKYLETVTHAMLSGIDALRRDFDVVLVCNAANAFVLPVLRSARIPVAINVDGIERRRRKWNALGRFVYMAGESLSARYADELIADAVVIQEYYRREHLREASVIAYGADFPDELDSDVLGRLGVRPGEYVLYVSRFEPENNPLPVLRAWKAAGIRWPLVMLGSAAWDRALARQIEQERTEGIILPGALYGVDYRTLQRHSGVYVQATEVGGIHPALIEAMGSGGAVLALDTPENREAGGDAIRYFAFDRSPRLDEILREWIDDTASSSVYRSRAKARVRERYSWDAVTTEYERLFARMVAGRGR